MINITEIPDDAHIEFMCPFCQRQNVLTSLNTRQATHVTLEHPIIQFHSITCPTCRKRVTFEATLIRPLPLPTI